MGLLELPPELRLHIYEYLAELQYGYRQMVSIGHMTPSICRTSRKLREETLPIYAGNTEFFMDINDSPGRVSLSIWIKILEPWLGQVHALRIGQVWDSQPSEAKSGAGFYLALHKSTMAHVHTQKWVCSCGTHPSPVDCRGMRIESAELLKSRVSTILNGTSDEQTQSQGLNRARLELIVSAMDIVAAHPIPLYNLDLSDEGRRRRQQTWERMTRQLNLLTGQAVDAPLYHPY